MQQLGELAVRRRRESDFRIVEVTMFEVLTRVAVEVGLAGTLASNREPGAVVRPLQSRRTWTEHRVSHHLVLENRKKRTDRTEINRADGDTTANVVVNTDGEVVTADEGD